MKTKKNFKHAPAVHTDGRELETDIQDYRTSNALEYALYVKEHKEVSLRSLAISLARRNGAERVSPSAPFLSRVNETASYAGYIEGD